MVSEHNYWGLHAGLDENAAVGRGIESTLQVNLCGLGGDL
jgi:hypothetical protein